MPNSNINPHTFIAEGVQLNGDITVREHSSIWFNAVLDANAGAIIIGQVSNVQDNSTIRTADNTPCTIGDYVTIGHNCRLISCTIEEHCLIGMGSTIKFGAHIGQCSIIGAGAVVEENTIVPPHSLVVGRPARVVRSIPDSKYDLHKQAVKYARVWNKEYRKGKQKSQISL